MVFEHFYFHKKQYKIMQKLAVIHETIGRFPIFDQFHELSEWLISFTIWYCDMGMSTAWNVVLVAFSIQ